MPYANVPAHLTGKMDDCVSKIMAKNPGMSKGSAIAICHDSIVKEADMDQKDQAGQALEIAGVKVDTDAPEYAQKMGYYDEAGTWFALGGATSFEELDKIRAAEEQAAEIDDLTWEFQAMIANVLKRMDIEDKVGAISVLTAEYGTRVESLSTGAKSDLSDEPEGNPEKAGGIRPWLTRWASSALASLGLGKNGKARELDPLEILKISSGLKTFRDPDGKPWAVGWVTNKYRDRDFWADPENGGEIFTNESHKEFISWLDQFPEYAPHLWGWHTPETASQYPAKAWGYLEPEGFVVMAWPLTEAEFGALEKAGELYPLGMSHGFITAEKFRDRGQGLIKRYRAFEASHLPVQMAANPWTSINTLVKEANMPLSEAKRKYFAELYGAEFVQTLEEDGKARAAMLDALGIQSKEMLEEGQEPGEAAESSSPEDPKDPAADAQKDQAQAALEGLDGLTKAIVAQISKELGIEDLNKFLGELQAEVISMKEKQAELAAQFGEVQKDQDSRIADLLSPANMALVWKNRPSQAGDNEVDEEEKKNAGPGLKEGDWVSQVIGPALSPRN